MNQVQTAVVAGHLCLDMLPSLERLPRGQFGARSPPQRHTVHHGMARVGRRDHVPAA